MKPDTTLSSFDYATIEQVTLETEMNTNGLEYGIAVVTDRALPQAEDGTKPVHKRVIYDALIIGATSNKPHMKSARVVGDTMGMWHPHGDSSIYGAEVRLAQNFVMRYPLLDPHGNFGNMLGDGAASMRYTEVRLSKLAEEGMLKNIKKNTEFGPNYDDRELEPKYLPAIFPNLLCNPNEGIAWGMACSWLPHNLNEVANAIYTFIDGGEPVVPGPDFPNGGIVINEKDIPAILKTGHGSVIVRGRYKIEKDNIIFYEIPYGTRVSTLIEQIGGLVEKEKLTGITGVRDGSGKAKGLRLIITVEKGVNPETVVNQLFSKTRLQDSISYNQVALVDGVPTELNFKDAINIYVEHNIKCLIREAKYDLNKCLARKEIVDGLLVALANIDNVIKIIKGSASSTDAAKTLCETYKFTENQVKAILDMKLSKLAKLEGIELNNELADLIKTIEHLETFIKDRDLQNTELKNRLSEIVKKFGDARRTELTNITIVKTKAEKEIAEVIPEECVVVTTTMGMIKRVPLSSYKVQKRNTKGTKNDELLLDTVKTNTIDTMLFFTDSGKMYRCVVDKIPACTNASKGTYIGEIVKFDGSEKIVAVSSLHRTSIPKFAIFFTKKGIIKKTFLEEYMKSSRAGGMQAIKLGEGDSIVKIIFMDTEDLIVVSKKGFGIKFSSTEVGAVGRTAIGVKAIKLEEDDEVITALPVHKETDMIAIFSESGLGKKMSLSEIPKQSRAGKGVVIYKEENIAGAAMVSNEDNILINGNLSSITISAVDIPELNRTASGNLMIKGNKIKSISKL